MILQGVGGRRFLLSLACGVAGTVLVYAGKIDGAIYRDIIIATVAAYITGNTWQKIKTPRQGGE